MSINRNIRKTILNREIRSPKTAFFIGALAKTKYATFGRPPSLYPPNTSGNLLILNLVLVIIQQKSKKDSSSSS